jgi:hypothetical protein
MSFADQFILAILITACVILCGFSFWFFIEAAAESGCTKALDRAEQDKNRRQP